MPIFSKTWMDFLFISVVIAHTSRSDNFSFAQVNIDFAASVAKPFFSYSGNIAKPKSGIINPSLLTRPHIPIGDFDDLSNTKYNPNPLFL